MDNSLQGKVAIVTGGSRGLGRGIVHALAAEGADVWAIARDPAHLEALARELPGVHTRSADVTDPEVAAGLLREVRPDIVVLNAGAAPHLAPVHEQSWDEFSRIWDSDVKSTFFFTKEAMSQPLAPGSTVVIVSSGAAIAGSPVSGGYAGAKRMQWFLASYLQQESRRLARGIRFVAVLPKQLVGDTALGAAAAAAYAERAGISPEQLLARFGAPLTPDGFGRQVVALLTDAAYADGTAYGATGTGLEAL
jgi:NAD(P)-dependent dehydrogenase (short-subunit alcohol dehydrogenase family)